MTTQRPSIIIVKSKNDNDKFDKEQDQNSPRSLVKTQLDSTKKHESFHQAVGPALLLGQIFGMLPVDGVLGKSEKDLNFRWKSPKTIYSILFLFFGTIESCMGTRRLLRLGFNIHFAESFLFFITAMIRAYMLFFLGRKWKFIMMRWQNCEDVFLREPYNTKGWSLSRRIRIVFAIAVILVLAEHIIFLSKGIENNKIQLRECTPISTDFWHNFLWIYRPHLAYNFPYSPYELPLYEWVNLLQAFAWNFSDIIVLLLSIGIKFRFDQFNNHFEAVSKDEKLMTTENFRNMRIHYYQLVDLVYFIDSKISFLILLSLAHNMLVLIIKIFSALNPNRYSLLDDLYFWFYIFFLALRIFSTLLSCSKIHDAASDTVNYIRMIPSTHWTIDLKRLSDTIIVEAPTLTFSGQKFFYITKTMMLALMGAIVTFELVLLDEVKEEKRSICIHITEVFDQ
ncbi:gustatory receptor for sugar taste 64b-like [Chironomus tepperi]|uniref:gustatory receptor for sugar taste 64b-like n=1 Tax=Chironomus tepperi TaxID=113505 RepID=UPI00391F3E7E